MPAAVSLKSSLEKCHCCTIQREGPKERQVRKPALIQVKKLRDKAKITVIIRFFLFPQFEFQNQQRVGFILN